MKTAALLLTAALFASPAVAQAKLDPAIEKKVDALLLEMTLEEKIGQLNQYSSAFDPTGPAPTEGGAADIYKQIKSGQVGSLLNVLGADATRKAQQLAVENSRLKIPLIFGYDVIHGYKTIFPVPLGESASWNMATIERSARIAATEAAAAGLHWTFAPMLDVSHDPRWGRIMEGSGEDPYLGSRIGVARVKGFQGSDLSAPDALAACAKHFAAYGFGEGGRDYDTVDISEQTLRNVVLPPFKAAADAGVATFMNSFNEIAGIPATASVHLQRDILKGEWGFQGFVVSDWGSIGEVVAHGYAKDLKDAARLSMNAGSDMDMEARAYLPHLAGLVKSGAVAAKLVDDAVRRVLRVKFQLGLFDDPYRHSNLEREKATLGKAEFVTAAREVSRESMVLLKNDGGVLPLSKDVKTIAVIGPLAADKDSPLGNWRGTVAADSAVSVLEGIQAAVSPATKVIHAQGAALSIGKRGFPQELTLNRTDRSGFPAAVEAAKAADVVVLALGEDAYQAGEGRSQADIGLLGLQKELLAAVVAANKNVVVVLLNGRPLAIPEVAASVPAILEAWHGGSQTGHAVADVLFGAYNPSGKLPASFPVSVAQLPIPYGAKSTGRGGPKDEVFWSHYTDMTKAPLYPFGFGLSYATFAYGPTKASAPAFDKAGSVTISATLTNTGKVAGTEVAQLYIRDLVGSVTRPIKELKGFERVTLQPGESKEVSFKVTTKELAFYTGKGTWEAEPGDFKAMIGGNSRDLTEVAFSLR
jgi:beta-glucosidase